MVQDLFCYVYFKSSVAISVLTIIDESNQMMWFKLTGSEWDRYNSKASSFLAEASSARVGQNAFRNYTIGWISTYY